VTDLEKQKRAAALRIARLMFAVSGLSSAAVALLIGLGDRRYLPIAAGLAAGVGVAWWLAGVLARRRIDPAWLLGLAVLNLLLVLPELGLRAAGFRYESGIEFGYPRPSHFVAFEPHERLFWTLRPGSQDVNSWGFPGPEIEFPKPEGLRRIVVLGDSCSQNGYPNELEAMLDRPGAPVDVVTLAIAGYSSHQGRLLAAEHGRALEADVALVYYGWNDHWQAWGEPDARKRIAPTDSAIGDLHARLLSASRLVGFLEWMASGLRGDRRVQSGELRVPPAQYRNNLEAIVSALAAAGTRIVLITAPTSYYRLGVPEHVTEAGLAREAATAVTLHRDYNAIVRAVAAEQRVELLDLESRFDALDDQELRAIFLDDGIHFTAEGHRRVAREVAGVLGEGP
jgi:lysophospholipase L1-like esterase